VKGEWKYLYRAVDKNGETLDVMLSSNRNKKEARKFFRKTLKFFKEKPKRVYTDKNQAYTKPIKGTLKAKHGIMHITVTPIEGRP
jgi:transposase-like protein